MIYVKNNELIEEIKEFSGIKIQKIESYNHTCVLTENGEIYFFGSNDSYQFGCEKNKVFLTPFKVRFPFKVVDIAVSIYNTFIVDEFGNAYGAGENNKNQLGNPKKKLSKEFLPITKLKKNKIVKCYSGADCVMYISNNGYVFPFGDNTKFKLGLGDSRNSNQQIQKNIFDNFDTFTRIEEIFLVVIHLHSISHDKLNSKFYKTILKMFYLFGTSYFF